VHACLDLARRRKRRVHEVELTPMTTSFEADASSHVANRELLDAALKRLEPEWRAVVVLHYYLGMPLPDVASELRIPLGTAKSRLHRSLGVMRTTLAEADQREPALAGGQTA
jgi:RNA polymerase sigma-70 factor, ECF subfamily